MDSSCLCPEGGEQWPLPQPGARTHEGLVLSPSVHGRSTEGEALRPRPRHRPGRPGPGPAGQARRAQGRWPGPRAAGSGSTARARDGQVPLAIRSEAHRRGRCQHLGPWAGRVLRADAPGRGHAGRTEFRREQVSSLCSSGPQERARADTGWTGPRLRTDLGAIAEQFEAPRSRRQWVWTEGSRGQGPGLRQARVRHGGDPPRGGSWWGGAGEGDAPLCPCTLSRVAGRGQVGRGSRKGPAGPGRGPSGRDGGVRPVSSASAFCSREAENSGGD